MRRLLCAFLAFIFCTAALSAECPIGYTPAQYIQLEYLESTGTQYIDTRIYPNNNTSIETHYFMNYASYNTIYYGATQSWNVGAYGLYRGNSNIFANYNSDINVDSKFGGPDALYGSHLVYQDKNLVYFDGILRLTHTPVTFTCANTLYLGRAYDQSNYSFKGKLYYFKIWDNETLVRDLVPAMRLGDGKPGMYDKVSGQFFTNAGTGEFIMGPEVPTEFLNTGFCTPCPPNTYKDFVGNSECTPCPDALVSPSGSKSASECGRVLHIGDKIYHMKSVKQTSPSLHIRDENGNVWYGNLYSEQE